jgi:NAD(P)H dehydrogenase (quinone)
MSHPRILVTGASGQLGRLAVDVLLKTTSAADIAVTVRSTAAGAAFAARGVTVHVADYAKPETLDVAYVGIDRLLLISSNDLGQRVAQHKNVIAAAKKAGVKLIAYTSVLHADTSLLGLADEHRQTEDALKASGVPFAVLRNGWYNENYAASIPSALAHNAVVGSAGDGLISSASRQDYAEAAAAVLTASDNQAGRIYELAGDSAYTLTQFAAEITKLSGKTIGYHNVPEAEFKAILVGAGLPEPVAALLSDSDAAAAKGALFDDGHALSRLIGRPTTPFAETVAAALNGQGVTP